MKLMLFNGPPGCGKDTAAKYLYHHYYERVVFERFSMPNKTAFAAMLKASYNEFYEVEGYEERKDEVIPWLGVSYRQWQIDFAESFMKPLYGKDIFTKLFIQRLPRYKEDSIVLVPDLGFQIEVDTLEVYGFDPKDIAIINTQRAGCDYSRDSREDVKSKLFPVVPLSNNSTKEAYLDEIEDLYRAFRDR